MNRDGLSFLEEVNLRVVGDRSGVKKLLRLHLRISGVDQVLLRVDIILSRDRVKGVIRDINRVGVWFRVLVRDRVKHKEMRS